MRTLTVLLAAGSLAMFSLGGWAAEKKGLELKDLPAAVQKTVADNLAGGAIKHIGKEREDGVVQFEVETVRNGKSRDYNVDVKGNLLLVEEETTLDAIPAPARASLLERVAGGKLAKVETFTKTGLPAMYEATYTDTRGKRHEVLVKADGTKTKE